MNNQVNSQAIFIYEGSNITIQCKETEIVEEIINSFAQKINISKTELETLFFSYNGKAGNEFDRTLTFKEIANSEDKIRNQINILVHKNILNDNTENKNNSFLIKSNYVKCPDCNEISMLNIKNYKIVIFNCKNGHKKYNLSLEEFEKVQYIDLSKIICGNCMEVNKQKSNKNIFYKCYDCNINLCPLCKDKHDRNHKAINYDKINYICENHDNDFIEYCLQCNLNICLDCHEDHSEHKYTFFSEIIPKKTEIQEFQINIENTKVLIDQFNEDFNFNLDSNETKNYFKEIFSNFINVVKNNFNLYYEIKKNIIDNFNNNKSKNYEMIMNLKEISNFNDIIQDINLIINEKNIKNKLQNLVKVYIKINQQNFEEEIELEKSKKENEDLKLENDGLEKELKSMNNKYNDLEKELNNVNNKNKEIENRNKDLEKELNNMNNKNKEIENRNKDLTKQLNNMKKKNNEIESRNKDLTKELNNVKNKNNEKEKELKIIYNKNIDLEKELNNVKINIRDLENKNKDLENEFKNINNKNNEKENELKNMKNKNNEIESRNIDLIKKLKIIYNKSIDLENRNKELEKELNNVKIGIRDLESRNKDLEKELKNINNKNRDLENRNECLQNGLNNMENDIRDLENRNQNLEKDLIYFKTENNTLEKEFIIIEKKKNDLEKEMKNIEQKNKDLDKKLKEKSSKVEFLEIKNSNLEKEKRNKISDLEDDLNREKKKNIILNDELDIKERELIEIRKEKEEMEDKLNERNDDFFSQTFSNFKRPSYTPYLRNYGEEKKSMNSSFSLFNNICSMCGKDSQKLENENNSMKRAIQNLTNKNNTLIQDNENLKKRRSENEQNRTMEKKLSLIEKIIKKRVNETDNLSNLYNLGNKYLIIELIANNYISTEKVADIMFEVDRADFTENLPYLNRPIPIGFNVTISAPHMHALALEWLSDFCLPNSYILDIGSGSGFLTLALSKMANDSATVVGVEHINELLEFGIENVQKNNRDLLNNRKIIFVQADGRLGYQIQKYNKAIYKAIHVGAASESLPQKLVEQLACNGRMFIPIGKRGDDQFIYIVDKDFRGNITAKKIFQVKNYEMLTSQNTQINGY